MTFEDYLRSLNLSQPTIKNVLKKTGNINKENQDTIYEHIISITNRVEQITLCYASLKYMTYKSMERDKISELLGDLNKINRTTINDKTFCGVSYKNTYKLLTEYYKQKKYLEYVILHLIIHYDHFLPCKVFQTTGAKTNDTQNYLLKNKSNYHYSLHTPTQFYRITSKKFMEACNNIQSYSSEDIERVKEELLVFC